MNDSRVQTLVTIQAIKDFLKEDEDAETKKKCVIAIIKEIKVSQGETLSLTKLDNTLFHGRFVPFIEDMLYELKDEFIPVKALFNDLIKQA